MRNRTSGSALILALIFTMVVGAAGAAAYHILQVRLRQAHQNASWQEALLAAESGVDLAVNALRLSIRDPDAWAMWHGSATEGLDGQQTASDAVMGAAPSATQTFLLSDKLIRGSTLGGARSWCEVSVDAPVALRDIDGTQWYRVRSLGVAEVPGAAVVAGDRADLNLRKFDLRTNRRTGGRVLTPQATRMIEAIVKPVGTFRLALLSEKTISMNNHNIVVDSYDSRDASKSNYDPLHPEIYGTYNVAERQTNGNIGTNGVLIDAGNAYIYGDVATNGGDVLRGNNVSGTISSDFYQELFEVTAPTLTAEPGSPVSVTGSDTLIAGINDGKNYLLSTINLGGHDILHIVGDGSGRDTYITIIVSGDIKLAGQSIISVDNNVFVRLFVAGNADITGGGLVNNNSPLNFQIYGCDQTVGTTGSIKIAGNGGLNAAVYAPNYDITMVGGGSDDSIFGSFVGNTITMTGVQSVHYDEALGDGGLIADYKVANWFEDVR
jgi:hypothetical protein